MKKYMQVAKMASILVLIVSLITGCAKFQSFFGDKEEAGTLDSELNRLTSQMVRSLSQQGRTKIAIVPFSNLHGHIPELGKFIAEELIIRMFQTERFEVVERHQLNRVVEEQHLGMSGLIDEESAAAIGRMLGVQAIVTGTMTDLGDRIRVNARMITTEKAEIFAVATVTVTKEDYIQVMLYRFDDERAMSIQSYTGMVYDGRVVYPRIMVDQFDFEVISARKSRGNTINIDLNVTNKYHKDWEIGVNPPQLFYGKSEEKVFLCSSLRIGSAYGDGSETLVSGFRENQSQRLNIEFTIDEESEIKSIPLLSFTAQNLRGTINLRNIPLN